MVGQALRRIAVYGGDLAHLAHGLADLAGVTLFGSSGQAGQGELRRLHAALRAGTIAEVCLVVRWAGHGETIKIRRLCRSLGVPCRIFNSIGAVVRALRGD